MENYFHLQNQKCYILQAKSCREITLNIFINESTALKLNHKKSSRPLQWEKSQNVVSASPGFAQFMHFQSWSGQFYQKFVRFPIECNTAKPKRLYPYRTVVFRYSTIFVQSSVNWSSFQNWKCNQNWFWKLVYLRHLTFAAGMTCGFLIFPFVFPWHSRYGFIYWASLAIPIVGRIDAQLWIERHIFLFAVA